MALSGFKWLLLNSRLQVGPFEASFLNKLIFFILMIYFKTNIKHNYVIILKSSSFFNLKTNTHFSV